MKFKMAEKSLFAILLRSPWWISFLVVGVIALLSGALLPGQYAVVGSLAGLPIFVVGCMAAWRQLRAPSAAKVEQMQAAVNQMPWKHFVQVLTDAWTRAGVNVQALPSNNAADLCLTHKGQTTLVSARRWKAATHGIEPVRELLAAMQQRGAQSGVYVAGNGQLSDSACLFAGDNGITILRGEGLALLLLSK